MFDVNVLGIKIGTGEDWDEWGDLQTIHEFIPVESLKNFIPSGILSFTWEPGKFEITDDDGVELLASGSLLKTLKSAGLV